MPNPSHLHLKCIETIINEFLIVSWEACKYVGDGVNCCNKLAEFPIVARERGLPNSYCTLLAQYRQSEIIHEFSNSLIVLSDLLHIQASTIFAFYTHFRISITTS